MASTDFYVSLLTSEHRDKPQFVAVVQALTQALADGVDLGLSLIDKFNLDKAQGVQLDAIGKWVGMFRTVKTPITGVYFAWDDVAATGWQKGSWQGPFDPSTGLTSVDDSTFRTLLRAKIAANSWDGTAGSLAALWDFIFGPSVVTVQDNQDMTMTVIYDSLALSTVMKNLLVAGGFPLKPMGVQINYSALAGSPIFSWDVSTPKFDGWTGTTVWA